MRDSWGQISEQMWTTSSINRLLKKFRDTGTVDRVTQLHRKTGFLQSYSHVPEVNKYASNKLAFCL